ncbi:diguanylate cyclase [Luteimonas sp. SJ-92]|uniref:diguanylate cyclase n=2 Tax=Luteimonas salinisoli TaxID=2752307 RepID=A0A853JD16_9GAMM|nr:diguanylate cyclase [Luteimonas salinisoli]NZA26644.1 diguanylate cyclase [Luteimonas salinisoli]
MVRSQILAGLRYGGGLVLLLLCTAAQAGPAAVELAAAADRASLTPHLVYHHDADAVDDAAQAFARADADGFAPLPSGNAAFGFQRGAFWFHAALRNDNPQEPRWLLVQEYPLSDRIDVYLRHADGRVEHRAGGDHLPFSQRSVRYRHPNFLLDLPPGERVDLLVRVESQSSMQVPLELYTPTAFTELSRDAQFAIGLYYGILLALFFYNLVLWLSLRDASYFWYLFHISAFGLVLFTLNGLGFEYLWPGSPWLADRSVPLSICLALVAMQQFARTFLELPQRWPRGNLVSLAVIGFFVLFGLASLWLPYRVSTPIASRAVLVGLIWIVVATVFVMRRGYAPARILLLAWAMFLLGTAVFTLLAFGLLPKNFATEYGVQIGSALEMLLLSVALGYRYAALRNENERIVNEARLQLERKVAQRTQEVRSALMQLEEAHGRLRDSSRRDGLTGLYNRTWFHEAFERMLDQARGERRPLSLLMIDLDHFKAINDRLGHLAGDECLRWAAHRIGKALRPHDALLARFGGEEFVVALPARDLPAAVAVAEEVRQTLTKAPCQAQGHNVRISASIGVHTINTEALDDIDDALEVADRALYAAKANGRDCVRTSISAA